MIKLFLVVLVLITLAFLGLGFNIFFRKKKFPEHEVGHNKNMKAMGIKCTKCEEVKKFNQKRRFQHAKLDISKINL